MVGHEEAGSSIESQFVPKHSEVDIVSTAEPP